MRPNKNTKLCLTASFLLFLLTSSINAQVIQHIIEKLDLYQQKYPEEIVYVQTDRSIYSKGELIWFKAYIMKELGNQTSSLSNNLYIALVDQDGLEVANSTFTIKDNQVSGNINIPEQLNTGNYLLIAHTGWMKNTPVDRFFTKEVKIENEDENALKISIKLNDIICQSNTSVEASIEFTSKDNMPVTVPFTYSLTGIKGEINKGEGNTNKPGKAIIKFVLPDLNGDENLRLLVTATYKGTEIAAAVVIPTPDNYLNVTFYPESGMILYGGDARIAFRAFNIAYRPVDFEGQIFDSENKPVQTIGSAYKGMGSFHLTPEKGLTYYLKITRPAGITKTFNLPVPRRAGIIMSLTAKTTDTLRFHVSQVNKGAQIYHFIGQMKGKVYWIESGKIANSADLAVPTDNFPAGVAEFVAFDTLKNIVAKRLVYVNENKRLHIAITTDKPQYAKRDKALTTITVTDEKGNPVEASLSLSVTNKTNQQPSPDDNNLFTYASLKSDLLGFIPTPLFYFNDQNSSTEALDNLLIANAFNRFTWRSILGVQPNNASFINMEGDLAKGTDVTFDKVAADFFAKDLTNSEMYPGISYIVQQRNDLVKVMNTDQVSTDGHPSYDTERNVMDVIYKIKPYRLAGGMIMFTNNGPNSLSNTQGAAIAIDGTYSGTNASVLDNMPVSDIDHINISTNPVDIQQYTGLNSMGIIEVFTKSGNQSKKSAESVSVEKNAAIPLAVFQSPDYNNPKTKLKANTDLRKTVFWKPDIQTDKSGKVTIVYFNGDIPSDMVITVEGRTITGLTGSNTLVYPVK
jgi:hypothetical protein